MGHNHQFGLPKRLGDGLILRWSTVDDVEKLAEFNFLMHNEDPDGQPELWLKDWTRELMSGRHPTTGPNDFTVIVDESDGEKIVSAMVLISQTWAYDGLQFGCGRPELVATDDGYRRRGLIRAQFKPIHQLSESRGELIQAITGIPWFYRQFGYEMALDLSGGRRLGFSKIKPLASGQQPDFRLRLATSNDLNDLRELYQIQCEPSLISCYRNKELWNYELYSLERGCKHVRNLHVIQTVQGEIAGYFATDARKSIDTIYELAVKPGFSLRNVSLFLARQLKQAILEDTSEINRQKSGLTFKLGASHPVYCALEEEFGGLLPPYAWFIRVVDLPAFLDHIRPVLEKRLAISVMAGHSGKLRLNFYRNQMALTFDRGRLVNIGTYKPKHFFDGDAYFPDLTFTQLLFGYRSLEELRHAYADVFTEKSDSAVLLKILFPKKHSKVIPVQ